MVVGDTVLVAALVVVGMGRDRHIQQALPFQDSQGLEAAADCGRPDVVAVNMPATVDEMQAHLAESAPAASHCDPFLIDPCLDDWSSIPRVQDAETSVRRSNPGKANGRLEGLGRAAVPLSISPLSYHEALYCCTLREVLRPGKAPNRLLTSPMNF